MSLFQSRNMLDPSVCEKNKTKPLGYATRSARPRAPISGRPSSLPHRGSLSRRRQLCREACSLCSCGLSSASGAARLAYGKGGHKHRRTGSSNGGAREGGGQGKSQGNGGPEQHPGAGGVDGRSVFKLRFVS